MAVFDLNQFKLHNSWFDIHKDLWIDYPGGVSSLDLNGLVPTITATNSNTPVKSGDTINVTWDDYEEGSKDLYAGAVLKGFEVYVEAGLQPEQPKQKKKKKKKKRAIEYNDPMRSISLKDEG